MVLRCATRLASIISLLAVVGWSGAARADLAVWCYPTLDVGGNVKTTCVADGGSGGGYIGVVPMPGQPTTPSVPPNNPSMIPHDYGWPPAIYRLVYEAYSDNLLTGSYDEATSANANYGWSFAQIAGRFVPSGTAGAVPLYRLVSYAWSTMDHLYTTSTDEVQSATSVYGYTNEGIVGYVFPSQTSGTCAMYRVVHGAHHLVTFSWTEAAQVLNDGGSYEGITGWAYPAGSSCPQ